MSRLEKIVAIVILCVNLGVVCVVLSVTTYAQEEEVVGVSNPAEEVHVCADVDRLNRGLLLLATLAEFSLAPPPAPDTSWLQWLQVPKKIK